MDTRKRRNPSGQISKRAISKQSQLKSKQPPPIVLPPPTTVFSTPTTLLEPMKMLPLTIYDFNGSSEYYEHMLPFLDTSALHLLCIHTADFHQTTPAVIEDIFTGKFDISSSRIITELFQFLQLLSDQATKTRTIMIVPIATCIDLYDKRPKEEK